MDEKPEINEILSDIKDVLASTGENLDDIRSAFILDRSADGTRYSMPNIGADLSSISGGLSNIQEKLSDIESEINTISYDISHDISHFPEWQYLTIATNILNSEEEFSKLGEMGWELVSVIPGDTITKNYQEKYENDLHHQTRTVVGFFKRRK